MSAGPYGIPSGSFGLTPTPQSSAGSLLGDTSVPDFPLNAHRNLCGASGAPGFGGAIPHSQFGSVGVVASQAFRPDGLGAEGGHLPQAPMWSSANMPPQDSQPNPYAMAVQGRPPIAHQADDISAAACRRGVCQHSRQLVAAFQARTQASSTASIGVPPPQEVRPPS